MIVALEPPQPVASDPDEITSNLQNSSGWPPGETQTGASTLAALQCEETEVTCGVTASSSTTKALPIFRHGGGGGGGGGGRNLVNRLYTPQGLSHAPWTFTIRLSAPNTTRYEVFNLGEL